MESKMQAAEISYAALIGLDWGDAQHALSVRLADATVRRCTVAHTAEAMHGWLEQLGRELRHAPVAVAVEAAHGALVQALLEHAWITLYPIHPRTAARFREAFTPSGAKDDGPDADILLELLWRHRDRLTPLQRDNAATRRLDQLCRARRSAVDLRVELTNRLTSLLKEYYPQALDWLGELHAPLALDWLTRWPTLAATQAARPATVKSFLFRHNVRRPASVEARLAAIQQARALTTDAVVIEVHVLQVNLLVGQLRALRGDLETLETAISAAFAAHPDAALFRELPGAGAVLAPRLLCAFGTDRARFPDADSFQRYVGVAPVREKSGERAWTHWRWTAPKFLRQSLVEWAGQTVVYCDWAKAYYRQQRRRGRRHQAVLRSLAFKWVRVLWRCWHDQAPYREETYLQSLRRKHVPLLDELAAIQAATAS
jgi:transposase